jgi:hypothetical protein
MLPEEISESLSPYHVTPEDFDLYGLVSAAIDTVNKQVLSGTLTNLIVAYDAANKLCYGRLYDKKLDENGSLAEQAAEGWRQSHPAAWFLVNYGFFHLDKDVVVLKPLKTVTILCGVSGRGGEKATITAVLGAVKEDGFHSTNLEFIDVVNDTPVFGYECAMLC